MIFEKIKNSLQKAESVKCYGSLNSGNLMIPLADAISIVEQAEAEYNNGWIPCSEKLPEDGENVLLCINGYEIQTGYRTNTRDGECFYMHKSEDYATLGDVIAWQPLPEPYTPRVDIKGE